MDKTIFKFSNLGCFQSEQLKVPGTGRSFSIFPTAFPDLGSTTHSWGQEPDNIAKVGIGNIGGYGDYLAEKCLAIFEKVKEMENLAGILNGGCLPIMFPHEMLVDTEGMIEKTTEFYRNKGFEFSNYVIGQKIDNLSSEIGKILKKGKPSYAILCLNTLNGLTMGKAEEAAGHLPGWIIPAGVSVLLALLTYHEFFSDQNTFSINLPGLTLENGNSPGIEFSKGCFEISNRNRVISDNTLVMNPLLILDPNPEE